MEDLKKKRTLSSYYIYGIIITTIVLIVIRILFYFLRTDENLIITGGRDADFILIKGMMNSGLVNFYNNTRMPYLYYWYFIFYPVYILPTPIGVYVWDLLRLMSIIYISKNLTKVTEDDKDLLFFFFLSGIGYLVDMFLNNNNWLLLLLLFESYRQLKKENKIISGILWTIAMYKITNIIFPFLLIFSKKIKIKDLLYYLLPFVIICIPYYVFPQYAIQMLQEWSGTNEPNIIQTIIRVAWQLSQTAQLLFMCFFGLIILISVKEYEKLEPYKQKIRILLFGLLVAVYLIYAPVSVSVYYLLNF